MKKKTKKSKKNGKKTQKAKLNIICYIKTLKSMFRRMVEGEVLNLLKISFVKIKVDIFVLCFVFSSSLKH